MDTKPLDTESFTPLRRIDLGDATQKRNYSRNVFAAVAPVYKQIAVILSFGRDQAWKRMLVTSLPEKLGEDRAGTGALCLDLACGTGDITRALSLRYPKSKVIGLDLSEKMIAEASREMKERPQEAYQNIALEMGDMSALPMASESVDLLTGGYALRNAPNLNQALGEMSRVLKPGSMALFLEFSKPPNKFLAAIEYGLLKFWGGLWGLLLHGKPEVYAYIAENLKHFPDREGLSVQLENNGLATVSSRLLLGGFLALTVCRKKENHSAESTQG
ncbi:class I SAM-dependent methyltransferase [Candidatus Haliotispira prima]|uniref:Class I SAM-dependent methyltransferase n=1 Tax=Candidatus Haliotispira prima TaxID=3034016 RepID=A0ABY8MJZ2_9SPIO|nr:class I SAM-dependent methyltransferase [Candidatus Haliotispira prima]